MYGLVFEIVEEWVIENQGLETWHKIKDLAGNKRKDQTYLRRAYYQDEELVDLINAASELLKISVPDILEAFGHFVIMHHFANGYAELLICQGSTLRQWLSNLNAMHDHVQRSFPGENFIAPIFWCEDCDEVEGSILLHYYTLRGTLLVPMVVGIVEQLASYHFDLEVKMNQIALQGEDGASFTSWRITAVDESQKWKLSPLASSETKEEKPVSFDGVQLPPKCPFSGRALKQSTQKGPDSDASEKCPFHAQIGAPPELTSSSETVELTSVGTNSRTSDSTNDFDFSGKHLKELFPFHIMVDQNFSILQLGAQLPRLLNKTLDEIQGMHIGEIVQITRPVLGSSWDWKSLNKLSDQNFFLTPSTKTTSLRKKVSMADSVLRFQASIYRLSPDKVMFALTPNAQNVNELNSMGLTLSDLPLSSCQRDAVFLGEHVAQEADKAHKLDKLSKRLTIEKDLSNHLLNNLLPQKVAEDLRRGKTVEPAYHENVTLFFSDIVGFTNICDQVEPWDVIDMMNQLFSVMDFLASHFDLYKVETVGDSYMCCSGLPEPDEYHAEKVANFALAVLECVKHVPSPVDGSPIQLRIGIHTGSCTSGVVGTLTPHYCLFGDMVNTASRHESTGAAGKIQCSSVLFGNLEHFSKSDSPQYNFRARGLVDMKGKGQHYTYWLESGTSDNPAASPEALEGLSRQVVEMLASKTWRKRRYFGRGGVFDSSVSGLSGVSSHDGITESCTTYSSSSLPGSDGSFQGADSLEDDDEPRMSTTIIDFPEGTLLQMSQPWETVGAETTKSSEDIIFEFLSRSLALCVRKGGKRDEIIQDQLQEFVCSIAATYNAGAKSSLHSIADVLVKLDFLWEARDPSEESPYKLGTNPWDKFVLLFSALIHRVKHTGSPNATLVSKQHIIAQMYEGLQSCQERRSVDYAFTLLEDNFADLFDEISFGCPNFRSLVRNAVLSTDLENEATVRCMLETCEQVNSTDCTDERQSRQRNQQNIGLILAVATVGPYTQSLDRFLQHSSHEYEKAMKAGDTKESGQVAESWYYEQIMFMKDVVLPLIEEVSSVLPLSAYLEEGATENIAFWDKRGKEWMAANSLRVAKVQGANEGSEISRFHVDELVSANVEILEALLANVVVARNGHEPVQLDDFVALNEQNPYDEIQIFIEMKKTPTIVSCDVQSLLHLNPEVRSELRDFVIAIAGGYESNRFHNFLHASHVTHLANLLLKGIRSKEEDGNSNVIAHDPLACFAIVLSALVHDVGHTGVPNGKLAEEKPELATKYRNKSIAEQNSIDTAWEILMSRKFKNLRRCLIHSTEEKHRLRKLLVNCVMATDIFDQDLRILRQSRWDKAFSDDGSLSSSEEEEHYKATIVMEHIMQASDVAHTMQDWKIYREWNESLFQEMYEAYAEGRLSKDPSDGWYEGELWFFDNWVIPLAQNLKECGVLDIVSDQLVKQARCNRQRWELEGKMICDKLCSAVKKIRLLERRASSCSSLAASEDSQSSASYLASQMITEAEWSSKMMTRYNRKYETAVGNLIALVYKGQSNAMDLEKQELSEIHSHLKQQDWYRSHVHQEDLVLI